jgi:hypothetical protein
MSIHETRSVSLHFTTGPAPARGCGESPILGIELSAEDARAKLWRTSDGRVYCAASPPTWDEADRHSVRPADWVDWWLVVRVCRCFFTNVLGPMDRKDVLTR